MLRHVLFHGLLFTLLLPGAFADDTHSRPRTKSENDHPKTIALVKDITVKSEPARGFILPLKCDGDGNIYLLAGISPSDGIEKLSAKGEPVARYLGSSASDVPVQVAVYFSIAQTGEVYQLAFLNDTFKRAVLVFARDGNYKSTIMLDSPPGVLDWEPSQVAAFPSGNLLVSGLIIDAANHISTPFTGIFSSSGQLEKQVLLSDDQEMQKKVESGDPKLVRVDHPYSNSAVEFGHMDTGADGNVYLLRNESPAVIYAIASGGEVARHFTVDTKGNIAFMQVADGEITLLDHIKDDGTRAIKIFDLQGHPIATYNLGTAEREIGDALACHTKNPDWFTFLGKSDDGFLHFKFVEPR